MILRKGNREKELYIMCNAYPSYTGDKVVKLIKSLDLKVLYDLLVTQKAGQRKVSELSRQNRTA